MTEEAKVNRELRRVDWRFLLPDPSPRRAVCFADALRPGLTRVVETVVEPGGAGECDLAVAIDPDADTIRAAFDSLRNGGIFCSEWYSPRSLHMDTVRRRVAAAGFRLVRLYWAWPPPRRAPATFWLPLDVSGASDYFLHQRTVRNGARGRLRQTLLASAWNVARRLGFVWPILTVAERPSNAFPAARSGLPSVPQGQTAATQSPETAKAFDRYANSRVPRILLTGGEHSTNKPVALLFRPGQRTPFMAVKMNRSPRSRPSLLRESEVLRSIAERHAGGLPGVPEVKFVDETERLTAVGESALTGVPLYAKLTADTYRTLALQGTTWLTRLAGDSIPTPPAAWLDRLVIPVLRRFELHYGEVADSRLLETSRDILKALGPLPLVPEQRDFSPWNVHIDQRGSLVVFDWESAEPDGLPAADLCYFLTYLVIFLDNTLPSGPIDRLYREIFSQSGTFGSVTRECLNLYTSSVGMDPESLHAVRLWAWMLHAGNEYERLSASSGAPTAEQLRGGLFFRLWQQEIRRG